MSLFSRIIIFIVSINLILPMNLCLAQDGGVDSIALSTPAPDNFENIEGEDISDKAFQTGVGVAILGLVRMYYTLSQYQKVLKVVNDNIDSLDSELITVQELKEKLEITTPEHLEDQRAAKVEQALKEIDGSKEAKASKSIEQAAELGSELESEAGKVQKASQELSEEVKALKEILEGTKQAQGKNQIVEFLETIKLKLPKWEQHLSTVVGGTSTESARVSTTTLKSSIEGIITKINGLNGQAAEAQFDELATELDKILSETEKIMKERVWSVLTEEVRFQLQRYQQIYIDFSGKKVVPYIEDIKKIVNETHFVQSKSITYSVADKANVLKKLDAIKEFLTKDPSGISADDFRRYIENWIEVDKFVGSRVHKNWFWRFALLRKYGWNIKIDHSRMMFDTGFIRFVSDRASVEAFNRALKESDQGANSLSNLLKLFQAEKQSTKLRLSKSVSVFKKSRRAVVVTLICAGLGASIVWFNSVADKGLNASKDKTKMELSLKTGAQLASWGADSKNVQAPNSSLVMQTGSSNSNGTLSLSNEDFGEWNLDNLGFIGDDQNLSRSKNESTDVLSDIQEKVAVMGNKNEEELGSFEKIVSVIFSNKYGTPAAKVGVGALGLWGFWASSNFVKKDIDILKHASNLKKLKDAPIDTQSKFLFLKTAKLKNLKAFQVARKYSGKKPVIIGTAVLIGSVWYYCEYKDSYNVHSEKIEDVEAEIEQITLDSNISTINLVLSAIKEVTGFSDKEEQRILAQKNILIKFIKDYALSVKNNDIDSKLTILKDFYTKLMAIYIYLGAQLPTPPSCLDSSSTLTDYEYILDYVVKDLKDKGTDIESYVIDANLEDLLIKFSYGMFNFEDDDDSNDEDNDEEEVLKETSSDQTESDTDGEDKVSSYRIPKIQNDLF